MIRFWTGVLIALTVAAGTVTAQDVLTIFVFDQELGTPLEGAAVTVTGLPVMFADASGTVAVERPKSGTLVTASLPGYRVSKKALGAGQTRLELSLVLDGFVEGKELVVESRRPEQTDVQGGVSQVVTSREIKAATMGLVEDALSSVKNLPGVSYTGSYSSKPSIRGGDPDETVATWDGTYVLYPYHWNGAYSIFNPDMVDSVKLSNGIVGASYGQVMSGLLDVVSKTPSDSDAHLDFGFSTTGLDAFVQQSFGTVGFMLGGKVTWMEVPLTLIGQGNLFVTDPYIRDGVLKLFWNPSAQFHWSLDGFLGTDGVATGSSDWYYKMSNTEALVSSSLSVLLSDELLWHSLVSYNSLDLESGSHFADREDSSKVSDSYALKQVVRYQSKTNWDWSYASGQVLSFGVEGLWETWSNAVDNDQWFKAPGDTVYTHSVVHTRAEGKNTVSSGFFVQDAFTLIPGVLTGEGGIRVDHSLVFGQGETLQTYPVLNPRLRMTYSLARDQVWFSAWNLNAGTGLYSQFPADNASMDTQYGVESWEVGPTRAWFNEVGTEVLGREGERFTLEGYFKNYTNRYYNTQDTNGNTILKYDGIGYVVGFDLGFKKQTQFWDASVSYSFMVTRLYNPGGSGLSAQDSGFGGGAALGTWYYPSYHRFHTFHADLTWKPKDGFAVITQSTYASGTPAGNGRTNDQYPVNIKFDWNGFYPGSKVRWESYFGVDDVFSILYYIAPSTGASFNSGFPIPSVGYKISF